MAGWDGRMVSDRPEPLIATAWLYATARRVLADEMGEERFRNWWFWQVDILDDVMMDDRWCDDRETPTAEICRDVVRAASATRWRPCADAMASNGRPGPGAPTHAVSAPGFRQRALLGGTGPQVPTPGDYFTVNRGGWRSRGGARFADVHGPGMRMAVDMSQPGGTCSIWPADSRAIPFSHYSDLLPEWAPAPIGRSSNRPKTC